MKRKTKKTNEKQEQTKLETRIKTYKDMLNELNSVDYNLYSGGHNKNQAHTHIPGREQALELFPKNLNPPISSSQLESPLHGLEHDHSGERRRLSQTPRIKL